MILNLELGDELAAQIETAARARGLSTREFVRETLAAAAVAPIPASSKTRFVQKVHDFGGEFESTWTRLAEVECEEYVNRSERK